MPGLSRRRFLASSAAAAGAAVVGLRSTPAGAATPEDYVPATALGDLRDIQHVVILMQENRSFDHYFGRLRGVRGFGDRSIITLPGGYSVFQQPISPPGVPVQGTQYPWHLSETPTESYPGTNQPPNSKAGAQSYIGTTHNWDDQHGAWAGGWMNGWVSAKTRAVTLGYLDRRDIPFYYALADAYTVGDAYHCSVLSSTGPNRTYLWSGTIDAAKLYSKFVAYSGGDLRHKNLLWPTYAESLESAGVSWKVYQCRDHFSDNALEYFKNFAQYDPTQHGTPAPGNPLYDKGITTVPEPLTGESANADNLAAAIRADVIGGTLPKVSWVVTNKTFSEHPDCTPNDGAYYVKGVLDALNANPDVFNSTLVIIVYDENDGQFDHVPPPVAPRGEFDEWYRERRNAGYLATFGPTGAVPVGLGFRVPLIMVSPWTRGGWVTSEVADHTSIIQLLEKWTTAIGQPALSANISDWRRRVCGDLTRALDFSSPVYGMPDLPTVTMAEATPGSYYQPSPTSNRRPKQEPGTKPARPLPYQPNANLRGVTLRDDKTLLAHLELSNNAPHAAKASHFAIYNNVALKPSFDHYPKYAPKQVTVDPVRRSSRHVELENVNLGGTEIEGTYDITVIGPNRFLRHFTGNVAGGDVTSQVEAEYYPDGLRHSPVLQLVLINDHQGPVTFTIHPNHYVRDAGVRKIRVAAKGRRVHTISPLRISDGWYDVTVRVSGDRSWSRRYVGHLETDKPSITGS